MKYGFGVDLGGTTVKIAWFDEEGTLLHKWEIPTVKDGGGSRILPDIAASCLAYLEQTGVSKEDVLGMGIGVPGPVNDQGIVNGCVNLGWGKLDISATLGALTGLPVFAGNDANVAALGECWKGGGQGCKNMVMATLGTGVGGGIIVNGHVIHGTFGAGGEIGHMVLNRQESRKCGCGKQGCVEQYCSATGIAQVARDYLAANDSPSALRSLDIIIAKDVFDCAKAGDEAALAILEQVCAYMGEFLANICCVVDPEAVVLGGGVSKAGPILTDGIRRHFRRYAFHACDPRFTLATLGNDAGAYGAFKLVLDAQ